MRRIEECTACTQGKQTHASFKVKGMMSPQNPLELFHINLFSPMRMQSIGGCHFCLVIIDDFSRYSWVFFLTAKSDTVEIFVKFCKRVENEQKSKIPNVRSDHGGEFINEGFERFCDENRYFHNFSYAQTP